MYVFTYIHAYTHACIYTYTYTQKNLKSSIIYAQRGATLPDARMSRSSRGTSRICSRTTRERETHTQRESETENERERERL
jgi:hypothetical protein